MCAQAAPRHEDKPEAPGATESEITDQMARAGFDVLVESGRLIEPPLCADLLLVRDIFAAMLERRPSRIRNVQ